MPDQDDGCIGIFSLVCGHVVSQRYRDRLISVPRAGMVKHAVEATRGPIENLVGSVGMAVTETGDDPMHTRAWPFDSGQHDEVGFRSRLDRGCAGPQSNDKENLPEHERLQNFLVGGILWSVATSLGAAFTPTWNVRNPSFQSVSISIGPELRCFFSTQRNQLAGNETNGARTTGPSEPESLNQNDTVLEPEMSELGF
jgi:hypothetical protein